MNIKLSSYKSRMVHDGKRNNREVLVPCSYCGEMFWSRWQRVKTYAKKGKNIFCSREHSSLWYAENNDRPNREGKENAGFSWDEKANRWAAFWDEDGIRRTTTKANWLWSMSHGKVPAGYWVTYVDGNPKNCELDNLELISRGERMSQALMGHRHSEETKKKLSDAHSGKVLSYEHKEKIRQSMSGNRNHQYVHGQGTRPYPPEFYEIRPQIKKRDRKMCQACGKRVHGQKSHVHHKDQDKFNNDPSNLITLCIGCHRYVHGKRYNPNPIIQDLQELLP